MKRAITEWGLVFTLVVTAATTILWVGATYHEPLREPLALATDRYVRISDHRLCLHSELGNDWKPNALKLGSRSISWVRQYTIWMAPGIEYHNRLYANGRTIWSLEISLVIIVSALLVVMAILWRIRLGRWLWRSPATAN
jgi:hypothetical protein